MLIIDLEDAHSRSTVAFDAVTRGIVFFLAVFWALPVAPPLTDDKLDCDVESMQSMSSSAGSDGGSLALRVRSLFCSMDPWVPEGVRAALSDWGVVGDGAGVVSL